MRVVDEGSGVDGSGLVPSGLSPATEAAADLGLCGTLVMSSS